MSHPLAGRWQPVYAELDGEEAPKMMLDKMEIEFTGGEYALNLGGMRERHPAHATFSSGHKRTAWISHE